MPSKNPNRQTIWNYLLTVIVSATMGAALTWLFMSQRPTSEVRPISSPQPNAMTNAVAPDVSAMSAGDAAVALGNFAYDHQRCSEAIRHYQDAIASGIDNADVTPRFAANSCAGPEKTRNGSPLFFLRMSMLRQPIALPMPVPNAFETASFPAKRAARCRAGNFIDIEYSISPSVKTRRRNFSPKRSSEC